jgi:hypothetical protein
MVEAHDQLITHRYVIHYPAHEPRKHDPNYRDFNAYRRRTAKSAVCLVGKHRQDFSECFGRLELHHTHIEFALLNSVDLKWLEIDYPGVSDPRIIGAWVNSAQNLDWLCVWHHRGTGGIHSLAASDFEAERYIRNLVYRQEAA